MPPVTAREENGDGLSPSSIDTLFELLSHSYRRYALASLREHRRMSLDDLADAVAAKAVGTSSEGIPAEDIETIRRSLYHTHIPMLVAADMVDYDQPEAMVSIRESAERATPFLALITDDTTSAS